MAEAAAEALARDLFAPLGPVRLRRMFGGAGVYLGDAMFALIAREAIFMKADAALGADYAAAGSEPFRYEGGGKTVTMSFWRLPEDALDDAEAALGWARRSLAAAEAARKSRKTTPSRRAPRRV